MLRIEEHAVVLLDRIVGVAGDLGAHRHDPTGEGRDFDLVGEMDAALRDLLVLVLADEDALADRLDHLDRLVAGPGLVGSGFCHDREG